LLQITDQARRRVASLRAVLYGGALLCIGAADRQKGGNGGFACHHVDALSIAVQKGW
jgi:hypothetical protein